MGDWYDGDCHAMYVNMRLHELRQEAGRDWQARQVRQAHRARHPLPLRARLGRLLIVAGEALARQPLEAPRVEHA